MPAVPRAWPFGDGGCEVTRSDISNSRLAVAPKSSEMLEPRRYWHSCVMRIPNVLLLFLPSRTSVKMLPANTCCAALAVISVVMLAGAGSGAAAAEGDRLHNDAAAPNNKAAAHTSASAPARLARMQNVQCAGTQAAINATMLDLYAVAFNDFEETAARSGRWTLTFEGLISLSLVTPAGHADAAEVLTTLRAIEAQVAPANVSIATVKAVWSAEWSQRAAAAEAAANASAAEGDVWRQARASFRAWAYGFTSERFADHLSPDSLSTYARAVSFFQTGLSLLPEPPCTPLGIPFAPQTGPAATLHAYWCPAASSAAHPTNVTILLMTGFDGSAELSLNAVGLAAAAAGFNVLVFEGPGQGSVARFQRVLFRPDWEVVGEAVVDFALKLPGVDASRIVLWGESLGGYLAPRAFSFDTRPAALVANGGMFDFFQVLMCPLPQVLQSLFFSNVSQFNAYMQQTATGNLALDFVAGYGLLGVNATTFGQMYTALEPYYQVNMAGIGERPVLVYNPSLDMLAGNQSEIFFAALPQPRAPATQLLDLDPRLGGALHSGVGSTANVVEAHLDWLMNTMAAL